jgi:hypothetical protein
MAKLDGWRVAIRESDARPLSRWDPALLQAAQLAAVLRWIGAKYTACSAPLLSALTRRSDVSTLTCGNTIISSRVLNALIMP